MSQVIKEKDIDRFSLRLLLDPMKPFEQIYALTMRFVIDERRWIKPLDFVLLMPDMSATTNAPGYFLDAFREVQRPYAAQLSKEYPELFDETAEAAAIEVDTGNRRILREAKTWPGYRNPRADGLDRLAGQ